MKLRLLVTALAIALFGCSTDTGDPLIPQSSSEGGSSSLSSGASSSGTSSEASSSALSSGASSSSSYTDLPDIDSSLVSGPTDLKVSSRVGATSLVITWTDVSTLPKSSYNGYQVFRNENYGGWKSVGTSVPEKEFFKDSTLDPSGEYKYLYRVIAYKVAAGETTYVSKFSNEAGVLPITEMGFGGVVFDDPSDFTIVRWTPGTYSIQWNISAQKPELGVVVQKLGYKANNPSYINLGDTIDVLDHLAYWQDLDTLGENQNHFEVFGSNSKGIYRFYAFYSDEFGRIWSEFSPEMATIDAPYVPSVLFKEPTVYAKVLDSSTVVSSWTPGHNIAVESANVNGDPMDSIFYEVIESVSDQPSILDSMNVNRSQTQITGLSTADIHNHLCSYSIRLRLVWIDHYGVEDRTDWSKLSGTVPGAVNLSDPNTLCPK